MVYFLRCDIQMRGCQIEWDHHRSADRRLPTAVRRPPTADRRPPTTARRPPTVDRRPPTVDRRPSTAGAVDPARRLPAVSQPVASCWLSASRSPAAGWRRRPPAIGSLWSPPALRSEFLAPCHLLISAFQPLVSIIRSDDASVHQCTGFFERSSGLPSATEPIGPAWGRQCKIWRFL